MNKLAIASKTVLNIQVAKDETPGLSQLDVKDIQNGVKHFSCHIQRVKNLIVDNSHKTRFAELTPDNMNPNKIGMGGLSINDGGKSTLMALSSTSRTRKSTADLVASPTNAEARRNKRVKPTGRGEPTKSGIFHFKDSIAPLTLFLGQGLSMDLTPCVHFCFHSSACPCKPQVCKLNHECLWNKIPKED